MQFQVPQFIEVEDKIFGPLTFRQFIYLFGGAGACYILWRLLPIFLAAPLILCIGGFAAALAFFQYNGRPFIQALENAFFFVMKTKLYLWNNTPKKVNMTRTAVAPKDDGQVYVPKLSDSRLHELAWSLDIKERIAAGVANDEERHVIRTPQDLVTPIRVAKEALVR